MNNLPKVLLILGVVALLTSCAKVGPYASQASGSDPTMTAKTQPTANPAHAQTPAAAIIDISSITSNNYPSVDGSTSAYPLQVMIACTILEVRCEWTEADFFNSTRRITPVDSLLSTNEHEAIFNLHHNGTHGAYMNLIDKNADLILVAREPSDDELRAAERGGVTLEVLPIALDAFVFLAHVDNPIDSLTLDQIRAIFTGEITDWAQVGGEAAEIHTYQRNPNSGSQELMEKLVMRGERMLESPDMILLSMMGPFSAIHNDPMGIGYSVFFYAENIYPDENVRMLAVEGVAPTSKTIADGTYPLITEVYVVVRQEARAMLNAELLQDWLMTEAGQLAVAASGYVSLND